MRHITIAGLAGAMLLAISSAGAQALTAPGAAEAASPLVQHAAQGCGRGFARGPRGVCRPLRAFGPRCVVRRTPWGPRRFCR